MRSRKWICNLSETWQQNENNFKLSGLVLFFFSFLFWFECQGRFVASLIPCSYVKTTTTKHIIPLVNSIMWFAGIKLVVWPSPIWKKLLPHWLLLAKDIKNDFKINFIFYDRSETKGCLCWFPNIFL